MGANCDENTAAPVAVKKTTADNDRNSGKHWDWETALRLLNTQTHYLPGCDHYNAFVDTSWKDAHIEFERSTCLSLPVKKKRPLHQLEGPTSPRIVTSHEHNKHTGMRPTVLSIYSFITSNHLIVPLSHHRILPEHLFTRVYKKS
jgi:hypothetical protein